MYLANMKFWPLLNFQSVNLYVCVSMYVNLFLFHILYTSEKTRNMNQQIHWLEFFLLSNVKTMY